MKPVLDNQAEIKTNLIDATGLLDKIRKGFGEEHWNDTKVDLSIAYAFFAPVASSDSLKGEGTYAALSYAGKLNAGQFTLVGRYAKRDRAWDKTAKVWNLCDSQEFGARYRGGNARSGFFVEYLYTIKDPRSAPKTTTRLLQGGFESKIRDDQWLQIAIGQANGSFNRTVLGINLSFNLSPTRILDERGAVRG